MRSSLLVATASLVWLTLASPAAAEKAPVTGEWDFIALLDGSPIGHHRFSVTGKSEQRLVVSEAAFTVKVLGFTAYRYRHHANEEWQGDCLVGISSDTDDDGKALNVLAERQGDDLLVRTPATSQTIKSCVMTFAYWNPALQGQTRLLDPQTGRLETVRIERIGNSAIDVRGKAVTATGFRIDGVKHPIDVWYGPDGQWVGLDSTVAGGRKLSYRLR